MCKSKLVGLGSLAVAGEMSSSLSSWDWECLSALGDRSFFQPSHNSDTVTSGRKDFLPLAGTKKSLETEDVKISESLAPQQSLLQIC